MLRFVNLVVRDAPLERPFHSVKKEIAPAVVAGIIAGGASVLNGLSNLKSQADANKTNRDIADINADIQRETNAQNKQIADDANALNYKMFQEQNEWNLEQWNRQNEYNSPEHMVDMYKKAGLNPAMLAGTFNQATPLSSAQARDAVTSYNTAPQLNYQSQPAYFTGFDGISTAVNAYFQNQLIESQKRKTDLESSGQSIVNDQMIRQMPYQLKKLQEESKKEGVLGDIARSELQYRMKTLDTRINMLYGDAAIQQKSMDLMDEQLTTQKLDNEMKRIMNAFQPLWNDAQLKQANMALQTARAQIGLILANTTLTYNQAATEIEKKVGQTINNEMSKVDLNTRKEVQKYVVDSALEDLNIKHETSLKMNRENRYHWNGAIGVPRSTINSTGVPGLSPLIYPYSVSHESIKHY